MTHLHVTRPILHVQRLQEDTQFLLFYLLSLRPVLLLKAKRANSRMNRKQSAAQFDTGVPFGRVFVLLNSLFNCRQLREHSLQQYQGLVVGVNSAMDQGLACIEITYRLYIFICVYIYVCI